MVAVLRLSNAYICDLDIYVGKGPDGTVAKRVGETVVTNLTQSFKGSGRNITMDNFFTSVHLAKTLLHDNLTLVGTVRKNKTEIPVEFMPHKNATFVLQHLVSTEILLWCHTCLRQIAR